MSENEAVTDVAESDIRATEKDIPQIIAYPERYGFKWLHEPISAKVDNAGKPLANGSKVELRKDAPRIRLPEDGSTVDLFIEWFGAKRLAKAFNGTSVDVESEGIVRSELLKVWHTDRGRHLSNDQLKAELVKRVLLGMRAKGGSGGGTRYVGADGVAYKTAEEAAEASKRFHTPKTFTALDGKEYPTLLESQQASVAHLESQGVPVQVAIAAVQNMAK